MQLKGLFYYLHASLRSFVCLTIRSKLMTVFRVSQNTCLSLRAEGHMIATERVFQ